MEHLYDFIKDSMLSLIAVALFVLLLHGGSLVEKTSNISMTKESVVTQTVTNGKTENTVKIYSGREAINQLLINEKTLKQFKDGNGSSYQSVDHVDVNNVTYLQETKSYTISEENGICNIIIK